MEESGHDVILGINTAVVGGSECEIGNQDSLSSGVDVYKPDTSRVRGRNAAHWTGIFAVILCQMNWNRKSVYLSI